jgi:chromosome segregation ATPase
VIEKMKLMIENAYGLKGSHTFEFDKGLNIISAPNASGSSSIIKAFATLLNQELLLSREALYEGAQVGRIALSFEGKTYQCELKRIANGAKVSVGVSRTSSLSNDQIVKDIVVVNEEHPLVKSLTDESIREYLQHIARIDSLYSQMLMRERTLMDKKSKLEAIKQDIKRLAYAPARLEELNSKKMKALMEKKEIEAKGPIADVKELRGELKKIVDKINSTKVELESVKTDLAAALSSIEANSQALASLKKDERSLEKIAKREAEIKEEIAKMKGSTSVRSRLVAIYNAFASLLNDAMKNNGEAEEELSMIANGCPICSLFKVDCNLGDIPINERHKLISHMLIETKKVRDKLTKSLDELNRELATIAGEKERSLNELKKVREALYEAKRRQKEAQEKAEALMAVLRDLKRSEADIKKRIGSTEERASQERLIKMEKISKEIGAITAQEKELKKLCETLEEKQREASELEKNIATLESQYQLLKDEYLNKLHAARRLFNEKAMEVIRNVGYKGFEKLQINENFEMEMKRNGMPIFLSELSTSEANAIAILISLAAKIAYFKAFPLFIIDTITTHFDPSKFLKFMDYLSSQSEYTIVTRLSPDEQGGIKILHGLDKIMQK